MSDPMSGPVRRGARRPLIELLPAFYRLRDADPLGGDRTLKRLAEAIDERRLEPREPLASIRDLEDEARQQYRNLFVETCHDDELEHFAALLGIRELPGLRTPRALIGDIMRFRRGKGTPATLEAVAASASGWPTRVVEYFRLLVVTSNVNHPSPLAGPTVSAVRDRLTMQRVGHPFESTPHTADIRDVARGRGRYNLPDIGIHLWRLVSIATSDPGDAVPVAGGGWRYRFHPLGVDAPLYTSGVGPTDEDRRLARPQDVTVPVTILEARADWAAYYGEGDRHSLRVFDGGNAVPIADVIVCDLGDVAGGWGHVPPPARVAVDPSRGRLAFATAPAGPVRVHFHRAWPMAIGARGTGTTDDEPPTVTVSRHEPADHTSIDAALAAMPAAGGVLEILDSSRYRPPGPLRLGPDCRLTIRASRANWPLVDLSAMPVEAAPGSALTLDGLLLTGAALRVTGFPRQLELTRCTLVPGLELHPDGTPRSAGAPSVVLDVADDADTTLVMGHCISGPIRTGAELVSVTVRDSTLCTAGADGSARSAAVLLGAPLAAFPAFPPGASRLRLNVGTGTDLELALATSPATLEEAATGLRAALAGLAASSAAAAASTRPATIGVAVVGQRLLVIGSDESPVFASEVDADPTATLLGLTAAAGAYQVGSLLGGVVSTPLAAGGLSLTVHTGPPGGARSSTVITLTGAGASLPAIAAELQAALSATDPSALVLLSDGRLRLVPGTGGHAVQVDDSAGARALRLDPAVPLVAGSDDGSVPAPALTADRVTLLGDVYAATADVSDSIVTGRLVADRRQSGCVRYSYVGPGSRTPRRFRSRSADDGDPPPSFMTTMFGPAAFAQQSPLCPPEIAEGAETGAEMGAFHDVQQPQRLRAVQSLIQEYLRFSAEAGIFLES